MKRNTFRQLILLIAIFVILSTIFNNLGWLTGIWTAFVTITKPFLIGVLISLFINAPMSFFERHLFIKPFYRRGKGNYTQGKVSKTLQRPVSLILSLSLVVGIMSLLLLYIIPELVVTVQVLPRGISSLLAHWQEAVDQAAAEDTQLAAFLKLAGINIDETFSSLTGIFIQSSDTVLTSILRFVSGLLNRTLLFLLGIIFAIYILLDKAKISHQAKLVLRAFLNDSRYNKFMDVMKLASRCFNGFISGQMLEAMILGVLLFFVMTIFGLPYAVVIAALGGLMTFVPILGAYITAIIGGLMILTIDANQALTFLIAYVVLIQIETNFIYPRVVGRTVKLPPLIVLLAVTISASLFGPVGLLLAIPLFSFLYALFRRWVYKRNLKRASERPGHFRALRAEFMEQFMYDWEESKDTSKDATDSATTDESSDMSETTEISEEEDNDSVTTDKANDENEPTDNDEST